MFGLKNVGNSCYVNSILQLFLNSDKFMDAVDKIDPDVPSFLFFIKNLKNLTNIRSKILLDLLRYIQENTGFKMWEQNDAHEFLVKILDMIEIENKDIYNLFVGVKESHIKCNMCPYENRVTETFNCLNFYLYRHDKFGNLLNKEFEIELLENCKCEKCGNEKLINYKHIDRFPEILLILNSNMKYLLSFSDTIKICDYHNKKIHYNMVGTIKHYPSMGFNRGHYTFSTKEVEIDDDKMNNVIFPTDFKNSYMIIYSQ